ncbi:MAG: ATP-dependent DNA ligase [Micrococcales bacterium]|nr:ATP-dependent DNA ligase [Micrococcales bacterium]
MNAKPAVLEVPGPHGLREVRISSPDRVLWPGTGMADARPVTKLDLARYLVSVAEPLLRAIGDRPVTLQRFPEGIEGEEFFSKNPPRGVPEYLRTVMCTYPSGRRHLQLVVDEVAGAVWAAQMNTITFHPWPVRTADVDRPDELRIDLDPQPGRDFADAVEAAFALREVMAGIGLTAWPKTSGNRGVHVYARIAPTHEFLDVRHGVIGIARELERRLPDLVTTSWWKEERGERIFVDFNQACRDRTIAAAYSPRPLPGAPVSTPVTWDELRSTDPAALTMRTVPALVAERGDAWAGIEHSAGDVAAAIALWDRDVTERGLGELNFPPDYPKMPGEPPRVQPSKRRKDRADDDYLPSKSERDAQWGMPLIPPIAPMLAKAVPDFGSVKGEALFEPKWDGFRSIVFRSGDLVEIGSRNEKPMTRYFPDVVEAVLAGFPERAVIDGEIILVSPEDGDRLDFELLQQRIHPAASRVKRLAAETPASFVAFDLLALDDVSYLDRPFAERRAALEEALAGVAAPIHLTPATTDVDVAREWFTRFEGAGLDGVIAKPVDVTYQPDKRVMFKIKHTRTADCVVAGYRVHKSGPDAIGSLLLGLHDADGNLASVGVIGAFPMARRKELFEQLQPLVADWDDHPWNWARPEQADGPAVRTPRSSEFSRWNNQKDLSFVPLRPERVVEVRYDHMEGSRFRHTAQFVRWREDRTPESCTFDQLEEPVSYDLGDVLSAG